MSGHFETDFAPSTSAAEDGVYRGTAGGAGGPRIIFDTYSGDLRLLRR